MKTKKLGWTELELSRIGLGTWAMGGAGWEFSWGEQDDRESVKTIYKALDMGINWIDSAPAYGLGHSEEVIGKALKGMKNRPLIATKCSRLWDSHGKIFSVLKYDSIKKEAENSLRRLQVETIDLYQVHWPRPEEDLEEGWRALRDLAKEGKIRYAGVSNFDISHIKKVNPLLPVASLQPPFNLINRNAAKEILPFCHENNIGVISYSPLYKGLLTGKYSAESIAELHPEDHRLRDPHFQNPRLSAHLELIEGLREIAGRIGASVTQLAIAWILSRTEITAAIVGARHPEQLKESVAAAELELEADVLNSIDDLLRKHQDQLSQIE